MIFDKGPLDCSIHCSADWLGRPARSMPVTVFLINSALPCGVLSNCVFMWEKLAVAFATTHTYCRSLWSCLCRDWRGADDVWRRSWTRHRTGVPSLRDDDSWCRRCDASHRRAWYLGRADPDRAGCLRRRCGGYPSPNYRAAGALNCWNDAAVLRAGIRGPCCSCPCVFLCVRKRESGSFSELCVELIFGRDEKNFKQTALDRLVGLDSRLEFLVENVDFLLMKNLMAHNWCNLLSN